MINYIKEKNYTLTPNKEQLGLTVSRLTVKREFSISIDDVVLYSHRSNSNNQYRTSLLTTFWAACLVDLYEFTHKEENSKIDWHTTETVKLQSQSTIISLAFKLFLLYLLIF